MTAFDPSFLLENSNRGRVHTIKYFDYEFETEFDSSVFDQLCDKFFYKSLKTISKHNGLLDVFTIGIFAEQVSSSSFILTDLDKTHVLCCAQFNVNFKPGTLILINCPEISLNSMIIKSEKQINEIGFAKSFGYCDKKGAHLACTKFVDRSKDCLCSFHKTYYKLRIANQFLIQSKIFPTSMPVHSHNHNFNSLTNSINKSSIRTYSTINSSI